tara:strand:+ start:78 stop:422 length:345 start_codon:yes stop_codon:yes gene_type:complete
MVLIQYPSNAEIKAGHNLPIFTRLTFGASSKKALSSGVFYKCFSGIILSPSQEVESNVRVDIEKKKDEEREFRMRRQRRVNDNNNTNDLLDLCKLPLFVLLDEDKNETKLKDRI